ncbi:MAG: hydroxymethylbilane synthase [Acidimicrobiales bacterium]
MTLRIATRRSPLALWQANHVADLLTAADPSLDTMLVPIETNADRRLDVPIAELGGKGAFSKEIQAQVLTGHADIAVHSGKDLQAITPDGLVIGAILARGDARDVLVGNTLTGLAPGARVGTGSNRRRVQLHLLRPDLVIEGIRGNIAKRLSQLDHFDAIVMAGIALERLGITDQIVDPLDPDDMIPQVAQGALIVECRADDAATIAALGLIDHAPTHDVVAAERAFLVELGGDCDLPAGAHCVRDGDQLVLTAMLADEDATGDASGGRLLRATVRGTDGVALGSSIARQLRDSLADDD